MSNTNSNRKRKSSDANDVASAPSAKKPDKYWQDFTRRARLKRERREARKQKDAAKIERQKKERAERRKKKAEEKKKVQIAVDVSSSESEDSSDDEPELKREDKSTFVPFHKKTTRFKDHICVITGGGRGIGQACALRLAQEGAMIYVLDYKRWKETVDMVTAAQQELHEQKYRDAMAKYHAACNRAAKKKQKPTIKKPRKVRFRIKAWHKQCDVTDPKKVQETIDEIVRERGYIDVVLNCVNTTGKDYGDTESCKIKLDNFDRIMKLNLYSVVNVCNAVIPYMKKEEYGRIVNLAALDGKSGAPKCLAFAAAKAAVINVTKSYGQEYAGTGITVNCIAPQYDEYHTSKLGKKGTAMACSVPMKRAIDMEELAGAAAFVASEENTYTTGFCYDLSGGTSTY